jgi:uncharacterized circularly permuted ATP-grasp superfamily protein
MTEQARGTLIKANRANYDFLPKIISFLLQRKTQIKIIRIDKQKHLR